MKNSHQKTYLTKVDKELYEFLIEYTIKTVGTNTIHICSEC